jgi:uncharacterized membrane protein YccC
MTKRALPFILGVVVGVLLALAFVSLAGPPTPEGEAAALTSEMS